MSDNKDENKMDLTSDSKAEPKKEEKRAAYRSKKAPKDFLDLVKQKIPEYVEPVKRDPSLVKSAVENLLVLEKKTRLGNDVKSTTMLGKAICQLCVDTKSWKMLNDQITSLCKKRAQLQTVIQEIIRDGFKYLDLTPDKPTKLELLSTLRTMAAGKIFVELERARMTKMLSEMKEQEGNIAEAGDILQEVQVETVGSMEIREKAAFLLEQIRLCVVRKDWVRAEIVANKVNTKALNDEKLQDLKVKHYSQLLEYHGHYNHYLDMCKCYKEIYSTKMIQDDPVQWKRALTKTVQCLVLAPFDSEVSDLLHRLKTDKRMDEMPALHNILTQFTTDELMRWPVPYEAEWKSDSLFSATTEGKETRWDDFHKRVVQHNVRVIGQFYERISMARLCQLLGLDENKTEAYVSEMVSVKQLYAKIDRPTGIIVFARKQDANDVLNAWSNDVSELLSIVEKTTHLINMENIRYKGAGAKSAVAVSTGPEAMDQKE